MEKFLKFLFFMLVGAAMALFNTWVFSKMWGWYLLPAFHLAVPKLYVLYGLMLTTVMFTAHNQQKREISDALIQSFSVGLVVLLFGWVVQAIFA